MKRRIVGGAVAMGVVLCAVLVAAFVVLSPAAETAVRAAPTSQLETTALPRATRVVAPPAPRFTRTVYAATSMPGSGLMLDLCRGPVAIDLGDTHPILVTEHDYCGGSAWIPRLKPGETVDLAGKGVAAGRYVVTAIAEGQRRVSRYSDLPDALVVLQTCISDTKIIMVGLEPATNTVIS